MHNDWSSGQSILIKVYDHSLSILNRAILDSDWTVECHKSRHINPLISNAFSKAGLVGKSGTGITKMLYSCKEAGNPVPMFETASSGLDFCVSFRASRLHRAIERCRVLNNDAVVDYQKVLSLNKLPDDDYGSLMSMAEYRKTMKSKKAHGSIYSRKMALLKEMENNPEITAESLSELLSIPERTIFRDLEWLNANGFLERIGSRKAGCWNVIRNFE